MKFVVEVDGEDFGWALESAKCGADEFVGLAIAESMAFYLSGDDEGCSSHVVVNGVPVTFNVLPSNA